MFMRTATKLSEKVLNLFLSLLVVTSMFISTTAHAKELTIVKDSVAPMEVAPCPLYGYHQMELTGIAAVYNTDTDNNVFTGSMYKCDCGEYAVCEHIPSPAYTGIGYFVRGYQPKSNILDGYWFDVPGYAIEYLDTLYVPGYRFLNS